MQMLPSWSSIRYSIANRFFSQTAPRNNSFDFIRIVAALMVVYSHSFALTGHDEPMVGSVTLGTIGVWVFFAMSGYLISASWFQYPRLNIFMAKRILRIFPALICVVLASMVVIGLFFTNLQPIDYFTNQATIDYLNNVLLYPVQYSLPGAFNESPYPNTINGSIWSLSYEFTMYVAVAFLGVFGLYKKHTHRNIWIALFILNILLCANPETFPNPTVFFLSVHTLLPLALMFFTGSLIQRHFNIRNFSAQKGWMALLIFIPLCIIFPSYTTLFASTLLVYALFTFANSSMMSWVQKIGDFSYGIYIYSFPLQQIIVALTLTESPQKLFAVSGLLSIIFGFLSWHFIESKALGLKSRIDTKRYPLIQADSSW